MTEQLPTAEPEYDITGPLDTDAYAIFEDIAVDAVKVGMVANAGIAEAVADRLVQQHAVPAVAEHYWHHSCRRRNRIEIDPEHGDIFFGACGKKFCRDLSFFVKLDGNIFRWSDDVLIR